MSKKEAGPAFVRRREARHRPRAPGLRAVGVVLSVLVGVLIALVFVLLKPEPRTPAVTSALERELAQYEAAWPHPAGTPDSLYSAAGASIEQRTELLQAEQALEQALVLDSDHPGALLLLLELSGISGGEYGPAPAVADELLAGMDGGWEVDQVRAALELGRGDAMVASITHRTVPLQTARARRLRMEIELALQRFDVADEHAAVLQKLWPHDSGACHVRARRMLVEGHPAQAEQALMACVVMGARDPQLYAELGGIADRTGRWEEAIALYVQAGEGGRVAAIRLQEEGVADRNAAGGTGNVSRIQLAWMDLREQQPVRALDGVEGVPHSHVVRAASHLASNDATTALAVLGTRKGPAESLVRARASGLWDEATASDPANPAIWRQRLAEDPALDVALDALDRVEVVSWMLRGPPSDRQTPWQVVAPASWDTALARLPSDRGGLAWLMAGEPAPPYASVDVRAASRLLADDPHGALALKPDGAVRGLALLAAGKTSQAHSEAVSHRGDPAWGAVLALASAARGNDVAARSLLTLALEANSTWTQLAVERYSVSLRLVADAPPSP